MIKILLFVLAGMALIYAAIIAFAYFIQRKLQYFPTHRDNAAAGNSVFKPWKASNGEFLGYYRESDSPKRAVLFFHGNAGEALDRAWLDELFPEEDVVVILAEYPGYGARGGQPTTQQGIFMDAERALNEIKRRWSEVPVTLLGESLGTAPASYLAAKKFDKVDRLALIAPFTSLAEVAAKHYSYLPVKFLLKDRFPVANFVKETSVPLHIVHGTLDDVVPIEYGRGIFSVHPGPTKQMTEIPGYSHNNIESAITDSPFAEKFRSFVRGN